MTTHSSPIARETVNYAMQCLHTGERTLALDAIHQETCGLTIDEQQKIEQIIQELAEQATPKELNLAEDRMIGVLQPETWAFMQDEKLVAQVLSYIDSYEDYWTEEKKRDELRSAALGIVQTSHARMHQRLLREDLAELRTMTTNVIDSYINSQSHLCDLDNLERPLNWEEAFACCPKLTSFQLDEYLYNLDYINVAKALQDSCPNFYRYVFNSDREEDCLDDLLDPFKNRIKLLSWVPLSAECTRDHLKKFLQLPHLTDLFLETHKLNDAVHKKPEIFKEFKRLQVLSVGYQPDSPDEILESISTLTLKSFGLPIATRLDEGHLNSLAKMTQLGILSIPEAVVLHEHLQKFLNSTKQSLKRIYLHPTSLYNLPAEFPMIQFYDNNGEEYPQSRKKAPADSAAAQGEK